MKGRAVFFQLYLTWACLNRQLGGGGGGRQGDMRAPHHNFVVIARMIIKFGTGVLHNGGNKN